MVRGTAEGKTLLSVVTTTVCDEPGVLLWAVVFPRTTWPEPPGINVKLEGVAVAPAGIPESTICTGLENPLTPLTAIAMVSVSFGAIVTLEGAEIEKSG